MRQTYGLAYTCQSLENKWLSIAVAAEAGREYYAENSDDHSRVNDWVKENVLVHLGTTLLTSKPRLQIRNEVIALFGASRPTFWAYYCAFDWVLLVQLVGDFATCAREVPHWPKLCMDLHQGSHFLACRYWCPTPCRVMRC